MGVQRPQVFIAVGLADDLVARIAERCDVTCYTGSAKISEDELKRGIADADGVLANPLVPFPAHVIDAGSRLRVITNVGVGYDNVDLAHASARGIAVTNTPGVLSDSVADFVLGLMITVARQLPMHDRFVREGRWVPGAAIPLGADLTHKTLSIIGYGRIGQEVAARALACKMRVIFYDARRGLACPPGVECVGTLDEALSRGDFVSLHVDLNETTRHMMGAREFALMKPGAFFINAARGGVVDQGALCDALGGGRIAGAALDVLETEPPRADEAILRMDNVYIVPHIGTATVETRRAMAELAVSNLLACLHGEPCDCVVNESVRG